MGTNKGVYTQVVELLEWMPEVWMLCEVEFLIGTGLGYVWHAVCEGFVPYHLVSGVTLGVVAETEEAVRKCIEGIAPMADWLLDAEAFFQKYPVQDIWGQVNAYVDELVAQGYPLLRASSEGEESKMHREMAAQEARYENPDEYLPGLYQGEADEW